MADMAEATRQFRQSRAMLKRLNNEEQEPPVDLRNERESTYYAARQAVTDLLMPLLTADNREAFRFGLKEYSRLAGILQAAALARYEELDARMGKVLEGGFATGQSLSDPSGQIRAEQNGLDEFYNNLIEKAIETLEESSAPQA